MPLYLLSLGIKEIQVKIQGALSGKDLFLIEKDQVCFTYEEKKACSSLFHWPFMWMVGITHSHPAALQGLEWLMAINRGMFLLSVSFIEYLKCAKTGPRLFQGQIPWKTISIRVDTDGELLCLLFQSVLLLGASTGTPSSSLTSYKSSQWNWVFVRCFDRHQDLKRWTGNCSGFCSQLCGAGFLNKSTDSSSCISTRGIKVVLLHSAIFLHQQINHNTKTASPKGLLFRCC